MRRFILFVAIITLTISSPAQITLTATTSNPLPGDTATFYVVNNVSTGDTGAAVIWDYSMLSNANKKTRYYHVPGGGCDPSPIPLVATGMGGCDYFQVDNDSFSMSHGYLSDSFYAYKDDRLILRYPLTYNAQVYIDSFRRNDSAVSWMVSFRWEKGYQQISSDAYGTLILPDSTYTDVLRVKKLVAATTHLWGSSNSFYNTMEVYEWYSADIRTFLLQVTNNIITGVAGTKQAVPEVSIYPNPAYSTLQIELGNASPNHIYLKDITGRKMQEITAVKGEKKYTMDVSGFTTGIYFVEVSTAQGVLVTKIQVL